MRWVVVVVAALALSGCDRIFGVEVAEQTLPAACGMCVFKQTAYPGCYWSVAYEGAYYAVNGPTPQDHDAHAPDGMCSMQREAVVAGTIRGEQIFVSKFELVPVDPSAVPAAGASTHQH